MQTGRPVKILFDREEGSERTRALDVGSGKVLCTDDSVIDETIQVMEPGYSHSRGGVACFSEEGGMTCLNAENLGFTLRQDEQVLY